MVLKVDDPAALDGYIIKAAGMPVTGRDGRSKLHVQLMNPFIPWMSAAEAERHLAEGYLQPIIEFVDGQDIPTEDELNEANHCIQSLAQLAVGIMTGQSAAEAILNDAGRQFSERAVALATQARIAWYRAQCL